MTLKTRCFSLSVSNSVYMVLSMETTCIGVMWLQMRVKPTTSLNRMVTSGNTWEEKVGRGGEVARKKLLNAIALSDPLLSQAGVAGKLRPVPSTNGR